MGNKHLEIKYTNNDHTSSASYFSGINQRNERGPANFCIASALNLVVITKDNLRNNDNESERV